jgi:hypothetical protein
MELPGFFTPGNPKEQSRLFTRYDGGIRVVLRDSVDAVTPLPHYAVWITRESGLDVTPVLQDATNQYILDTRAPDGSRCFVLEIRPDQQRLWPGAYVLITQADEEPPVRRSLNVGLPPGQALPED